MLWLVSEGDLEVSKDTKVLGMMAGGRAFGELAILYNCTRTASVKGGLHYILHAELSLNIISLGVAQGEKD